MLCGPGLVADYGALLSKRTKVRQGAEAPMKFLAADFISASAILLGVWAIKESLSPKAAPIPFTWREVFRNMGPVEKVGPWPYRLVGASGIVGGVGWFALR